MFPKKQEQTIANKEYQYDKKSSPSPPPSRFSNIRNEGKMNGNDDEDNTDEPNRVLTDEFEAENGKDEEKDSYDDNDESSGNNDLEDEELHSVGAATSRDNSPPSSPPPLAQVKINSQSNQEAIGVFKGKSNANPNFIGEITEYYELPFIDTTRNFRKRSKSSVKWKGVDWNIMSGINDQGRVGFFLGFDKSDHLPNDWVVHFRYKFELLDVNDKVLRGNIYSSFF